MGIIIRPTKFVRKKKDEKGREDYFTQIYKSNKKDAATAMLYTLVSLMEDSNNLDILHTNSVFDVIVLNNRLVHEDYIDDINEIIKLNEIKLKALQDLNECITYWKNKYKYDFDRIMYQYDINRQIEKEEKENKYDSDKITSESDKIEKE